MAPMLYNNTHNLRKAGLGSFLLGLLQVILNPRQAWNDAYKDAFNAKSLLTAGLVPFLIIVGFSSLIKAFYYISVSYMEAIFSGVIDFTGYFVSIFICNYLFTLLLKRYVYPARFNANNVLTFIIYSVSSMALMTLLNNVFPADLALLSFLPLYVLYIMWCGASYLNVPDDYRPHFIASAILTVFTPPYVLSYCLSLFI